MDKRQLIKRFTQEGYTLRPECLNHLTQYFAQLKIQNNSSMTSDVVDTHMTKIIENVKVLSTHQGDIILGEQTVKGAIELLQRPPTVNNSSMELEDSNAFGNNQEESTADETKQKQVNDIIDEKYHNTIIVLDTIKETPRFIISGNKPQTEFLLNGLTTEERKRTVTLGSAQDKVAVFKMRYDIIKSKLSKSRKYRFGQETKQQKKEQEHMKAELDFQVTEISDIGELIGSKEKEMVVLGMIYEGYAGEYYIQDDLSRVKLDISNAVIESGYMTVTSIVLAKGVYDQMKSALAVSHFIMPTYDDDLNTSSLFQKESQDFFGTKAKVARILGKLIQLEIESASQGKNGARNLTRFQKERQLELGIFDLDLNPYFQQKDKDEYCICIFSDFSLSDRGTLKKFESILQVYEQQLKPLVIILMGQFFNVSEILSEASHDQVKEALSDFQAVLNKFKTLRDNCYWIMIPHINDIGGASIQPKCELPEYLFAEIKALVPFFKLAQNPCRISIIGKTFLIQRNDLLRELRKKQIVINPHKDIQLNYVQTILSQRHLSPLPLLYKPTLWNYDHTLEFYENPDYLILADSYSDQFDFIIEDKILTTEDHAKAQSNKKEKSKVKKTFVVNPGNFEKKSTFTVIYPLTGETQNCSV